MIKRLSFLFLLCLAFIGTQQSAYGMVWIPGGGGGAHATNHVTGGSDEVDGDKLDIDWTPSNYTPATSPTEADNADNLTAHLYGIDQALGSKQAADDDLTDLADGTLTGSKVSVAAGDTYTNYGVAGDDTLDELFAAIDTAIGTAAASGIDDIVEDLTPQLGGDLDVNGKEIQSAGNIVEQLGDNAGTYKHSFQDSDGAEVAYVDSNGVGSFESLILAASADPGWTFNDSDGAGSEDADKEAGKILVNMITTTEDSEDADMWFQVMQGGTEHTWLMYDESDDQVEIYDTLNVATGQHLVFGTTQWDNGSDKIDGDQIADDTIDDDSIDFGDVTFEDFSGAITADSVTTTAADDPYVYLDPDTASESEWYIGINNDSVGDDNDSLEIRQSSTPGDGVEFEFQPDGDFVALGDITATGSDLLLGTAGVKLTGDGDGAITFLGLGDGEDEDLTLNLDDTANTGVFTSSTGLNALTFNAIALVAPAAWGADITGNVSLGAGDFNKLYLATGAGTVTLDDVATVGYGQTILIRVRDVSETVIIEVDDADKINLYGTALAAGNTIDSPGAAGDFITLISTTDADGSGTDGWVTLGSSGTWTDGGAT